MSGNPRAPAGDSATAHGGGSGAWEPPGPEGSPGTGRCSRGPAGPAPTPAGPPCSCSGPLRRQERRGRVTMGVGARDASPDDRTGPSVLRPYPQHLDSRKDTSFPAGSAEKSLDFSRGTLLGYGGWGGPGGEKEGGWKLTKCGFFSPRSLRATRRAACSPSRSLHTACLAKTA